MASKRQLATVKQLKNECTLDNLWDCIIAFEDFQFYTTSGLPYSYHLKVGRNGEYNKELFIDRTTGSKTLVWSSILTAFHTAVEKKGEEIIRPKALGDVRGVSYIYPLFYAFGMIKVPESAKQFMVKV